MAVSTKRKLQPTGILDAEFTHYLTLTYSGDPSDLKSEVLLPEFENRSLRLVLQPTSFQGLGTHTYAFRSRYDANYLRSVIYGSDYYKFVTDDKVANGHTIDCHYLLPVKVIDSVPLSCLYNKE